MTERDRDENSRYWRTGKLISVFLPISIFGGLTIFLTSLLTDVNDRIRQTANSPQSLVHMEIHEKFNFDNNPYCKKQTNKQKPNFNIYIDHHCQ